MRKIVLRDLPKNIKRMIKRRARRQNLSFENAVIEFIHDVEIQAMVDHDLAILSEDWEDEGRSVMAGGAPF